MLKLSRRFFIARGRVTLLAAGLALAGFHAGRDAVACPSCQCGDPAVLLMGPDAPYRGFWRFGVSTRVTRMRVGTPGVNEQREREERLQLVGTYAPTSRLFLSVVAPVVRRTLDAVNGGRTSVTAPGDLEVRSRVYLWGREEPGRRLSLGMALGGTAPTARRQYNAAHQPLDIDVQPGLGAWTATAGLWASAGLGPWGLGASATFRMATEGWEEHRSGRAWLTSASVRCRVADPLALQMGIDMREADRNTYSGVPDGNSGGFTAFAAPGLTVTTAGGMVLDVGVQIPVSRPAAPAHRDDLVGLVSLTLNH